MVVLASVIVAVLVRRLHRDESYPGLTPGELPAPGQAVESRRGGPATAPTQPRPTPPDGLGAGLTGVVVDGRADRVEVVATLIEAAGQGRLRITERAGADPSGPSDWLLSRPAATSPSGIADEQADASDPAPLALPTPQDKLIEILFADADEVVLSELPLPRRRELNEVADVLIAEAEQRGWFRRLSHPADAALRVTGPALLLLGAAAIVMVGRPWLGAGMMLAGVAFWALTQGLPNPPVTADGWALRVQALGYRDYLGAESGAVPQDRVSQRVAQLPYALVFGLTDLWRERTVQAAGTFTPDGIDWLTPLAPDGRLLADDGALPRLLAALDEHLLATRPIADIPSGASSAVPREPTAQGSLLSRLAQRSPH